MLQDLASEAHKLNHSMANKTTILGVVIAAATSVMLTSPLLAGAEISPEEAQGMPNCDITCGNMSVPYPFGMGPARCYWPGFNLTCNRTSNPPRLLLGDGTLQVKDLSIRNWSTFVTVIRTGDIKVDGNGKGMLDGGLTTNGPYTISSNKLIVTGCNVQATLKNGDVIVSSCSSFCNYADGLSHVRSTLDEGMQCSGSGCCQSDIVFDPAEVAGRLASSTSYDVQLKWFGWNRSADHQWPAHVFIARYDWFSHALLQTDAPGSADAMQVPLLLYWEVVGHGAECSNVCKSKHSECIKGKRGYICLCNDGYQGNPYITNGCKDIDECNERDPKCYGDCTNSDGSYVCQCPPGTHGDATKPDGCFINSVPGNCSTSCGDIKVPYPFGIGSAGCYWPGFNLACNTSQRPAKLLLVLNEYPFHVTGISLENNTVRLSTYSITHIDPSDSTDIIFRNFSGTPYSLSTHNELILSGCNLQATLTGGDPEVFISGCASFCPSNVSGTDLEMVLQRRGRYCNGMGCCQANIPTSSNDFPMSMMLKKFNKNDDQELTTQPAYMVIAEEGWFDRQQLSKEIAGQEESEIPKVHVPLVLQWEVIEGLPRSADMKVHPGCPPEVAGKLCKSKNSDCKRGSIGYLCRCMDGYDKPGSNPYLADGCKGGRKPLSIGIYLSIGVAVGTGIILFFLVGSFTHKKIKHRKAQMLKKKFFEKNRGQLLLQLVSQRADIAERMIITLEELEKATNKFDKARELGGGGHGTVYKGILSDLHVVAIKKPKAAIQKEIDEFINEVAILSQINHRNVVKLYGCCLETEVPMLVYEFISNGTLYDHLHVDGPKSLSWNDRLRIATETARSLAHLHSTASVPIIHRDIKSVNILLDDTLTSKVADFGASRYVPVDRSGITTRVQGTRGYLDPMYFYTGRLMEKSDVYSFGVLLLELLTRKKPFSYISSEDEGLVTHFSTLFTQGNLSEILDPQVMEEGGSEMEEVAALAAMCITLRGEDRPTMKQVEIKLEGTQASREHEGGNVRNCPLTADGSGSEELSRQYSMEEEFALSSRYPR